MKIKTILNSKLYYIYICIYKVKFKLYIYIKPCYHQSDFRVRFMVGFGVSYQYFNIIYLPTYHFWFDSYLMVRDWVRMFQDFVPGKKIEKSWLSKMRGDGMRSPWDEYDDWDEWVGTTVCPLVCIIKLHDLLMWSNSMDERQLWESECALRTLLRHFSLTKRFYMQQND